MPDEGTGQAALPAIDYAAIGRRIRRLRKQLHRTQAELGRAIGKSTAFIGHVERGTRVASLQTVLHIAMALCVPVDALLMDATGLPEATGAEEAWLDSPEMRMLFNAVRVLRRYAHEWRG